MNTVLLTGIILLIVVAVVFIFLSIKLKKYSKRHNSTVAEIISGWCSSISSGAVFALVFGLVAFFIPNFQDWNKRKSSK